MYKRSPGLSWKRGKLYSKLKGSQYRFQDEIKIGAWRDEIETAVRRRDADYNLKAIVGYDYMYKVLSVIVRLRNAAIFEKQRNRATFFIVSIFGSYMIWMNVNQLVKFKVLRQ